jgi:hypothetical protein
MLFLIRNILTAALGQRFTVTFLLLSYQCFYSHKKIKDKEIQLHMKKKPCTFSPFTNICTRAFIDKLEPTEHFLRPYIYPSYNNTIHVFVT